MLIKRGDSPGEEQFINIAAINPGSPELGAAVSRSHSPATISRPQPPNQSLMYRPIWKEQGLESRWYLL